MREMVGWLGRADPASGARRIAGYRSGSSLKDDQCENVEYRDIPYGATIPSIKERVLTPIAKIERQP